MTARTVPAGAPAGLRAASNGHTSKPALDLDAWCAEARQEPFVFVLGGHTFTLPHVGSMDWQVTRDSTINQLLRTALGDDFETFNALHLPADGYNELQRRWFEHSGITLPESPASPT